MDKSGDSGRADGTLCPDTGPRQTNWVEVCLASTVGDDLRRVLRPAAPLLAAARPGLRRLVVFDRLEGASRLRVWLGAPEAVDAGTVAGQVVMALSPPPSTSVEVIQCRGVPDIGVPFHGSGAGALIETALDAMVGPLFEVWELLDAKRISFLGAAIEMFSAHLRAANTNPLGRPNERSCVSVGTSDDRSGFAGPVEVSSMPSTFLSFRSHAEGFFLMARDPVEARARFASLYATRGPGIRATVGRALREMDGAPMTSGSSISGDVRGDLEPAPQGSHGSSGTCPEEPSREGAVGLSWRRYVMTVRPDVESLVAAGRLSLGNGADGYIGETHDLQSSRFHQIIDGSPEFRRFMSSDPRFLTARILTSLLYFHLQCLGLPLVQRYFACYAVSRACEELTGIDGDRLLGQLVSGSASVEISA